MEKLSSGVKSLVKRFPDKLLGLSIYAFQSEFVPAVTFLCVGTGDVECILGKKVSCMNSCICIMGTSL